MIQDRHVLIMIGELIYSGMFATGAARCAFEASKGLSRYYRVTILGRSGDGSWTKSLSPKVTLSVCGTEDEERVSLRELLARGVDFLVPVVDHALETAVVAAESDLDKVALIYWSHLAAESYGSLPGLRAASRHIDCIITPTAHEATRLVEELPELTGRVASVVNGIRRPRTDHPPHANPTTTGLLFVGRRSLAKGYDLWLSACTHLAKTHSELTFTTVGLPSSNIDPHSSQLRSKLLSSGRLTEISYLSPAALAQTMSSMKALVLPTRRDCFPVCVLEAMHLGIPAIVSDIPNLSEIAGTPPAVILCDQFSGYGFAASISRVLAGGEAVENTVALASSLVTQRYSLENCVNGLRQVFEKTASRVIGK